MHFHYNPYIWVYLGGAVMLFLVTCYTVYKRVTDRLWIVMQATVIFWCLGFALQISGTDLKTAAFWYLAANDFVGLKVPVIWLMWSLAVIKGKRRLPRLGIALLFLLPAVTDVLNLTNSRHGLVYAKMWLGAPNGYPLLLFNPGPWYWLITAYCGILLLAVIISQIRAVLNRELLYRRQGLTIATITACILCFIIICLISEGSLFGYYDLTPVAISLGMVFTSLVFRFRVQEAVPVPRNAVMEKMDSAVLILDNRDRIMDVNPAAETVFGIKADKAAGHGFGEVLADWQELTATVRDKSAVHMEFFRNDRYYEVYISELNDGRKAVGRLVVLHDVTANKAAEAKMLQQQQALLVLRERERLARELHDTLGQVLGYTNIQIQNIREMLQAGQFSAIEENLNRLSQIIMEANTEVREFIYEVKTTLLFKKGLLAALQQYISHYERNFRIPVETRDLDALNEDELDLTVKVQLFRIIQEALANVRKHAQARKVTIAFQKKGGRILISVTDDGIGFDPKKLAGERSFFGLEVMRERAGQFGGELLIDAAPGRGTTVTVIFPCVAPDRTVMPEEYGEQNFGKKIRVLLADDHYLFMEGLQNLITPKGFEVVGIARDGLEALEKARLLHPDMILMDLQMPRCNGLTATRLIKAEMPEIKIVILTMSDREPNLFEAVKNGATGYLLKGLRAEELIAQLRDLASGAAVISSELAAQVLTESASAEAETVGMGEPVRVDLETVLTQKQIEILALVAKELTYKEVASRLYVSERTVKYQMADIIKRLNLRNRQQAIAYARKAGLGKDKID